MFLLSRIASTVRQWLSGSTGSNDDEDSSFDLSSSVCETVHEREAKRFAGISTEESQSKSFTSTRESVVNDHGMTAPLHVLSRSSEIAERPRSVYSMDEVRQHRGSDSRWLVIRGRVFDVTHYIQHHPGGDIILEGIGKDATELYDDVGHSESADAELEGLYIGDLSDE